MLCSNKTNFSHLHILKTIFENILFVNTLEDWYKSYHKANRRTKAFSKRFFKTHKAQAILKTWAKHLRARRKIQMERGRTPSLSIIYPITQKILEKVFFCSFHHFFCWIKEKSVATLAYRNIYEYKIQTSINSRFCHRITELVTLLGIINKKVGLH